VDQKRNAPKPGDIAAGDTPPRDRSAARWLRLIKIAIVVMGLMLLAGAAIIVSEIVKRSSPDRSPAVEAPAAASSPFGETEIRLPAGSRVIDRAVDGGRLVLFLENATGGQQALVIDLSTGGRLGSIRFTSP